MKQFKDESYYKKDFSSVKQSISSSAQDSFSRRDALKLILGGMTIPFLHCSEAQDYSWQAPVRPELIPSLPEGRNLKDLPNIIFILSDDHRWDYLSCMNHPFIETKNMDRLAEEGVHFYNAFVTTSLCSPSRASFLTGQYSHTHGVKNNLCAWDNDNVTFLELLKGIGYDTAFIGKWHMPGEFPKLRGVDRFITFTAQAGQGRYFDCPLIIDGKYTQRPGTYVTKDLTDYSLNFIEQEREAPFCLYLSHKAIHHQFFPPPEYDSRYENADLNLPKEANPWVPMINGNTWSGQVGNMETHLRNYCEAIYALDVQIGRILNKLDEMGIADNTIIVYAGDNGYFWGEHRLVDKRWPYEEAIRIPFLIRYPAGMNEVDKGRISLDMVLNIDLAPTLLSLIGADIPEYMEGNSLVPIINPELNPGQLFNRAHWHYEYFKEFPYNTPSCNAVRTDEYIYIEYDSRREPELFDVKEKPYNTNNLIASGSSADPDIRNNVLPVLKGYLSEYLNHGN